MNSLALLTLVWMWVQAFEVEVEATFQIGRVRSPVRIIQSRYDSEMRWSLGSLGNRVCWYPRERKKYTPSSRFQSGSPTFVLSAPQWIAGSDL